MRPRTRTIRGPTRHNIDDVSDDDAVPSATGAASTTEERLARGSGAALWPKHRVEYKVASSLPNKDRVWNAMREWKSKVGIRFAKHRPAVTFLVPHPYVTFAPGKGCFTQLGRPTTGKRHGYVRLGSDCPTHAVVHEIGHVLGAPRAQPVGIETSTSTSSSAASRRSLASSSFATGEAGTRRRTTLHSIMHYSSFAGSIDGKPTMLTKSGGIIPNKRLSHLDITGMKRLYGF